jgi:hypothetical protein
MSWSYLPATPSVIGVRITPGRTSKTAMPSGASRSANSLLSMPRPAFDRQYSPRSIDARLALTEDTVTIERGPNACAAAICRATACVKKKVPRRLVSSTLS